MFLIAGIQGAALLSDPNWHNFFLAFNGLSAAIWAAIAYQAWLASDFWRTQYQGMKILAAAKVEEVMVRHITGKAPEQPKAN